MKFHPRAGLPRSLLSWSSIKLALPALALLLFLPGQDLVVPSATSRTVVSVRDFGAAGDGKSDDAASIQRAIDSLPQEGGTVLIPKGIYLLGTASGAVGTYPDGSPVDSALIIRTPNVELVGEGPSSVMKLMPGRKMRVVSVISDDVTIHRIHVDGNKAERNGSVAWPGGDVVNALVYGRFVRGFKVTDCEVRDAIEDGIGVWRGTSVVVQGCVLRRNGTQVAGGAGIALSASNDVAAVENHVLGNTAAGIWTAFGSSGVEIRGNLVEFNSKAGISTRGTKFVIAGNLVRRNGEAGAPGINIFSSQDGSITDNRVTDNLRVGIQVQGDGSVPSARWKIERNECSNTTASRVQGFGIRILGGSENIDVRDNTCTNNGKDISHQIVVETPSSVNSDWREVNRIAFEGTAGAPNPSPEASSLPEPISDSKKKPRPVGGLDTQSDLGGLAAESEPERQFGGDQPDVLSPPPSATDERDQMSGPRLRTGVTVLIVLATILLAVATKARLGKPATNGTEKRSDQQG